MSMNGLGRRSFFALAVAAATGAAFASAAGRPLIVGISEFCPANEAQNNVVVRANYADAVARGGHVSVVIPRYGSDRQFDALVARLDVLVLTGGEDVSPARYGEPPSPNLGAVNPVRDDFDFRLLAAARRHRLPVIGICRGCQLINVAFGGTLWQDLPSEFPAEKVQHRNVHHPISILPDSRLARTLGCTNVVVNSSHHQAVKKVAPGFRVVATSPEGVVEAIESDDYPAVGVQFHPERLVCDENKAAFLAFFNDLPATGQRTENRTPCNTSTASPSTR